MTQDESRPWSSWASLVFIALLVSYLLTLWTGFQQSPSFEQLRASLVLSERLGLAAEFCEYLPEPLRDGMAALALRCEDDSIKRALLRGERPSRIDPSSLTDGYRLLSLYRLDPSSKRRDALSLLAYRGLLWMNSVFLLFCGLQVWATLLCLFGSTELKAPPAKQRAKLFSTLTFFLTWSLWSSLGLRGVLRLFAFELSPLSTMLIVCVLRVLGLIILSWLFLERFPWEPLRLGAWKWVGISYYMALGSVFLLESVLSSSFGGDYASSVETWLLFLHSGPGQRVTLVLLAVFLGPLSEEFVFRVCLLEALSHKLGKLGALLVTSSLFSIAHGELAAIPGLFVLGILFGSVYLKTRSLWHCVALHSAWNATTLCYLFVSLP